MNIEINPANPKDLLKAENNDGYFAFLRLHAIGHYVIRVFAKTDTVRYKQVFVPTTIEISDDYPPKCYVNATHLPSGETIEKAGVIVKNKS